MSVLVEALSVIARRETIESKYPGGLAAYKRDCPNRTYCADEYLVRVGFMTPTDVGGYLKAMSDLGLVHLRDGKALDFVVIDQFRGPTSPCE